MSQIRFRKYLPADFIPACRLVRDGSKRYFHKDIQTEEGRIFWRDFQSVQKSNLPRLGKLFQELPIKIVAVHNSKVIGLVTGKPDELVMLFVRAAFHRKGIATELFSKFKQEIIHRKSKLLKVKSSRYAEPFYAKMGFVRTGKEKLLTGLPSVPMEMSIGGKSEIVYIEDSV